MSNEFIVFFFLVYLILTGTMYAGLQLNKLKCWCGNKLSVNDLLSEESCEAHGSDDQTSSCMPTDNIKFFSTGLPGLTPYIHVHMTQLWPRRLIVFPDEMNY